MVEEIVETGIQFRAHQEKATINSGKHNKLGQTTHIVPFEEIKITFLVNPEKHHAEQVFKNTNRSKNVEETVFCIVTVEPQIIRKPKENRPENSRDKERSEKHPQRTVILSKKPTAKPGRNRIANEETGERPRRFIEFHAEIGHD